jgi:hypothetical protein
LIPNIQKKKKKAVGRKEGGRGRGWGKQRLGTRVFFGGGRVVEGPCTALFALVTFQVVSHVFTQEQPWTKILLSMPSVFFFFLFKMILLAYNSCTGGYTVIFTYVFKIYLS